MFKYPTLSEEDFKHLTKFKVYLNYVKSISDILDDENFKKGNHLKKVINSPAFLSIKRKDIDTQKIQSVLRNAWATEMQLAFTAEFPVFSNHWAVAQLYYSVYLVICALLLARKDSSPKYDSHHSALNKISNKIKSCPDLFPYPWNLTYIGDPRADKGIITLSNLKNPILLQSSQVLSTNQELLVPCARFLKTTRQRQLEEKREQWLKSEGKGKKNLPPTIRKVHLERLPATTLFDCLYRLRIKANYRDAETFFISDDDSATSFNYSLINISKNTLLIIELLIARYIGEKQFSSFVKHFKTYSKNLYNGVEERWDLLSSVLQEGQKPEFIDYKDETNSDLIF